VQRSINTQPVCNRVRSRERKSVKNELHDLVTNFVANLQDLWQRQALAALTGASIPLNGRSNGHSNGASHSASNGASSKRAKGEKRSPEEMEATANKLLAYVDKNPGLRIEQINKAIGTTTKDLQLPIHKLIADGALKTKGAKRSTTYFAK